MKPDLNITVINGEVHATLAGELTIRYQKEMKALFIQMIKEQPLSITVSNPDMVDLCFLQLWWAFVRQLNANGHPIKISSVLPESEEQLLKRLNLLSLLQ